MGVLTAPGTTAQEVIDSSVHGISADEVQARAREMALSGKKNQQAKKGGMYGDSMQKIFDTLMTKALKVQRMENEKLQGEQANAILKTGVKNIATSLQARRWLQVQNFQRGLAHQIQIPSPPIPPSHLPLGVVVVRFRQLREAVWSSVPLVLDRTLRLNSRGRLKIQIDFRPKFQTVPDAARLQPVREFHTPRKAEMKESELEIGEPHPKDSKSQLLSTAAEIDDPNMQLATSKSMGKTFFEVNNWCKVANAVGDAYEEAEFSAGIRKGGIADSTAAKIFRRGMRAVKKNAERRRFYDTQIQVRRPEDGDQQVNQFFGDQPKYIAPSIRMDNKTLSRVEDSRLY